MLINLRDPIYRLRSIALIEGFSFLLLLFVSMPLKYYMGMRGFIMCLILRKKLISINLIIILMKKFY